MAKWNNQGGSSRGTKNRTNKARDSFDIPRLKELTESNSTSFKIVKAKKKKLDYGQFGDAIWDFDTYIPDLDEEADLTIKTPRTGTLTTTPPIYRDNDYRVTASDNIDPVAVRMEYEIIVKFAAITITILTGQAYAARNELNDSRFDRALVLLSNLEFGLGNNAASTVNLIKLSNTTQNPIYSLYNWLLDKLAIATDTTGQSQDSTFSELSRRYAELLPVTNITFNNAQYNLFYGEGIAPLQICLSASNTALDFDSSGGEKYWNVLIPGARLAVCASNQPTDPPNPDPDPEYRFIILFDNINGISIGGYDAANHSDLLLPDVVTKYAINPIAPNTSNFTQLKPRIDDGYPDYRGMYWRVSWFETDFNGLTRFKHKDRNNSVTTVGFVDDFDSSDYQHFGGNKWATPFLRNGLFGVETYFYDFILRAASIDGALEMTNDFKPDKSVFTNSIDQSSAAKFESSFIEIEPYTEAINRTPESATEFDPYTQDNTYSSRQSIGASTDRFYIESDYIFHENIINESIVDEFGSTFRYTQSSTDTRSSGYRFYQLILSGQLDLIQVESMPFSEQLTVSSSGYSQRQGIKFETQEVSQIKSTELARVLTIGSTTLNIHPVSIETGYQSKTATTVNGIVDLSVPHRRISVLDLTIDRTRDGGFESNYVLTLTRNSVSNYVETRLYESITSGGFVIISADKIVNAKTAAHAHEEAPFAYFVDPTKYNCTIERQPSCPISYYNQYDDIRFTSICNDNYTGFDPDSPDGTARKITDITYSTKSAYVHSIPDYIPRIIFVGADYFDPENCVLAKTNEPGLIARIYKSKQVSSTKAIVEDWAIHSSGWIELTSIKQMSIGEFAGSLSAIYYYPGT